MASATRTGDELQFLEAGREIDNGILWLIRTVMAMLLLGAIPAALATQSGASYIAGAVVGVGFLYWILLKIASSERAEDETSG